MENCIENIRQQSEFHRFLLGPSKREFKEAAREGPIAVVNITDIRSDAFITSTFTIKAISLPKLRSSEARGWKQQNLTSWKTPQECRKKQRPYLDFLRWLWATYVAPIMQELVYSESPKLLRICVGIASLLPFHAGSNHARESTENTFSRAMSSYAPSIKALRCSRKCVAGSARKQGRKPRLLIIRMPTNPSQTSLPGVIKEESEVQSIMKDICSVQLLPHANATEVVNGLDLLSPFFGSLPNFSSPNCF